MCSVVGCESWRRSAPRFKLPADPENRLEWVRFLAAVNGQGFRESSWTDITICREHFTGACFEDPNGTHHHHRLKPGDVRVRLKPGAVPSLCLKSEPEENEQNPSCEPAETTETLTHDSPAHSEESSTSEAAAGSDDSCSADTSDAFPCDYSQMLQNIENIDIIREKAARLHMKGKYVVNEKQLLKLFSSRCPTCGSTVKMEKFTRGILLVLERRCPRCGYRNQWRSQVQSGVATEELTGGVEVTPPGVSADDSRGDAGVPEISAIVDEQSDGEDESSDPGDMGSDDEEWTPAEEAGADRALLQSDSDEESEVDADHDADYRAGNSQLCTECGLFFNRWKPHTCVHKVKPFSCNICGRRCVSEAALGAHGRVHEDGYEHRCKFCHVKFVRKADKAAHERAHLGQAAPYRCPDCPEAFASNKERRLHLKSHRGPVQLRCDRCGIQFNRIRSLRRHLLVHTGAKPHKCPVCGRGFNQAGHLKSHSRMHTGEKPYKCRRCDKCFNHNVSLKNHVQRYHAAAAAGPDDADTTPAKKRNITRPIGRPRKNAEGWPEARAEPDTKAEAKPKGRRSRKSHSDEESDGESSCDSTVEKEVLKTKSYGVHNTGRATWKRRWKVKE